MADQAKNQESRDEKISPARNLRRQQQHWRSQECALCRSLNLFIES